MKITIEDGHFSYQVDWAKGPQIEEMAACAGEAAGIGKDLEFKQEIRSFDSWLL